MAFFKNEVLSVIALNPATIFSGLSNDNITGNNINKLRIVVTACSLAGSNLVRFLKSDDRFFLKIDLIANAKLEAMAILWNNHQESLKKKIELTYFAAFVVNSLLIVATFRFPRVEA